MEVNFKYNIGDIAWGFNHRDKKIYQVLIKKCLYGTPHIYPDYVGIYYDTISTKLEQKEKEGFNIWHRHYTEEHLFDTKEDALAYTENDGLMTLPNEETEDISGTTENVEYDISGYTEDTVEEISGSTEETKTEE